MDQREYTLARGSFPDRPATLRPLTVRRFGAVNWVGLGTLYVKEVQRFAKLWGQTVLAPVITTLLYLAVFTLALGGAGRHVGAVPYLEFLGPGLVMMAVVQNAFSNTASSILISKVQGNIVDVLMPPLTAGEFTFGYAMSGATRGIFVSIVVALSMLPFVSLPFAHVWAIVIFGVLTSLLFSLFGLLAGLWAEKFDHMAAIANFVITPLAFLSGTFYSVDQLPPVWRAISRADPLFLAIDGFRYGFIGQAEAPVLTGALVLAALTAALWTLCLSLVHRGYKLKA